ncbi:MAG: hypothetical protein PF904_15440 [Kiritimatiellae bacterium]|jgi:hypothetical protein|nr:hypothetical protein [Kiritimatiellia bacterium]
MTFEFPAGCFKNPVLVDLRNGKVFDISKKDWSVNGTSYKFENIPVYDSPVLIADRTLIKFK